MLISPQIPYSNIKFSINSLAKAYNFQLINTCNTCSSVMIIDPQYLYMFIAEYFAYHWLTDYNWRSKHACMSAASQVIKIEICDRYMFGTCESYWACTKRSSPWRWPLTVKDQAAGAKRMWRRLSSMLRKRRVLACWVSLLHHFYVTNQIPSNMLVTPVRTAR